MSKTISLQDLLIRTPAGEPNDYICILLEDVEVCYEDGSYVNLLAVDEKRATYIQGRVMPEPDQLKFVRDRNLTRTFIKEPLEGMVTHSSEPMAIWTVLQNKWFEIRPHTNYRATYEKMMHVIGVFWSNDKFVDVGGVRSMARDTDLVQSSMTIALSYYMTKVGGSSTTLQELLTMLNECRRMLKDESNQPCYKNSPLVLWVGNYDQILPAAGSQIAAVARQMLKVSADALPLREDPSPAQISIDPDLIYPTQRYPRGVGQSSDIVYVSCVAAMWELSEQHGKVERVGLGMTSYHVDRIFSTGLTKVTAYIMIQNRDAILAALPLELKNSKLRQQLETPVSIYEGMTNAATKKLVKIYVAEWEAGTRLFVRRGQGQGSGNQAAPARVINNPLPAFRSFLSQITSFGNNQIQKEEDHLEEDDDSKIVVKRIKRGM